MKTVSLSRRKFLLRTGWIAAGVTVVSGCSSILPVLPVSSAPTIAEGRSWIQLLPSGKVRFLNPRAEMGQGANIGLSQVVATELNLGPSDIECVNPTTSDILPVKSTVGSESIQDFFDPTAHSAALLREALRHEVGRREGVPLSDITDGEAGFAIRGGRKISYQEIASNGLAVIGDDDFDVDNLRLYSLEQGRIQATRNLDWACASNESIVTGKTVYSRDVVVDGMLYGRIIKPRALGARLGSVDASAARAMASVVKVIVDRDRNCVGVVCRDPFLLIDAVDAVDVEWELDQAFKQSELDAIMDIERYVGDDDFEHTLIKRGDMDLAEEAQITIRRYRTSMAAHGAMEARAAVVSVTPTGVEIWGASQNAHFIRARVARVVGTGEEQVTVHIHRMGGAFGGRILCQAAEEAALLSMEVGEPVRVQWTREEEFRYNHVQPPFDHIVEASVSDQGKVVHWRDSFTASPIIFTSAILPGYLQSIVDFTQEDGSPRGAHPPYDIPNLRIRYSDIRTPLVTSAWRGLGAAPNTFAVESMMDELAIDNGHDPVAFRLANLGEDQQRLKGVITAVAQMSDWGATPPTNHGLGFACAVYKKTPVAVVVEVHVDPSSETIKVTRAWIAQDCGLVINPNQVRAQIEGNLIWGLSFALKERAFLDGGHIGVLNFDDYTVARMSDAPNIQIDLIERGGDPPIGAGEPAIAPTPAAIANAIFAATGKRARQLPVAYEDISV